MSASDADVAIAAASAGAAVVRAGYGTELRRYGKDGRDFATQADIDAEQAIRAVLSERRPSDAVIGEELGGEATPADRRWLVDPLCGTANFAAQTPLIGVNVALRQGDGYLAAAVADPIADEIFWCDDTGSVRRRRAGADARVTPSATNAIVEVSLSTAHAGPDPVRLLRDDGFSSRFDARYSSTGLAVAWVAVGRRAGYVTTTSEPPMDSVHFAAAIGLCLAAGAVVTDLRGHPLGVDSVGMLVAADADTHAHLLEALADQP